MNESGFFSFLDHLTYIEDDSSNYEVVIGDQGFSYLDMVSEKKARSISFQEKQNRDTSAALDGSTGARGKLNVKKIEKADHDELCFDTDLNRILLDIDKRRKTRPLLPFAIALVVLLFLLWLLLPSMIESRNLSLFVTTLCGVLLGIGSFIFLLNVRKLDYSRRHVRFAYRFSEKGAEAFDRVNEAIEELSRSGQLLLYEGRRHFEDTRYSGGAGHLPSLTETQINRGRPPLVEVDQDVWHIRAHHRDMYFMPDHLMVFEGARTGGISYSRLDMETDKEVTQARDKVSVARDSKVVGQTYRFVNNDGTPDQRFNNNVQIPLVEMGLLSLTGSGLELTFFCSSQGASGAVPDGFAPLRDLASKANVKVADERRGQARLKKGTSPDDVFVVLLDAVCCLMVADGVASGKEKQRIVDLMSKAKSPWNEGEIDEKIEMFIGRVENGEFSEILRRTCDGAKIFKELGKEEVLLRCLNSIAKADGRIDKAERVVFERLQSSLK